MNPRPQNILFGVSLIIATAFTISVQDVVFKLFSSQLTLWQIFALRGLLAVPMLVAISWLRGVHKDVLRAAFSFWPLLRATFITTTFLAYYGAIPFLSLSTVGAANYIAPIFVALLSAYALQEPVRPLGWLGVLLGFVGVIVLLRPGTDAFSPWVILPVIGAAFYSLVHITTRAKCQDTPLAALALSQNFVMMLAGIAMSAVLLWKTPTGALASSYPYIFGQWAEVGLHEWMILVLLAGFAIILGMMLAGAYQVAPPPVIATFEYSYLIFVATWDIAIFGISPTPGSVIGMGLIVVAGLLVLHRAPTTKKNSPEEPDTLAS